MSEPFAYRNGELHAEGVTLSAIAREYGTPAYVYSRRALHAGLDAFHDAFAAHPHLVCYAVKANSNLGVLDVLARRGAGFDIVSGGELARVLRAGGDASKIVYSGVAKTVEEIRAALQADIHCFNVESESELAQLDALARSVGKRAPVALRVNPDVDADTHPYIATGLRDHKFGIPASRAEAVYAHAATLKGIAVTGLGCHIGSQILNVDSFAQAVTLIVDLAERVEAAGTRLAHLDIGGGLGISYADGRGAPTIDYARAVLGALREHRWKLVLEPGRAIAGPAGVLLTRVQHVKAGLDKHFAIVDAGMNDLLRPALYDAWQDIVPVRQHPGATRLCDVVGPVCESADFIGLGRELAIETGDLLAVRHAGAYGFTMSSNYNSRMRPAELMVDGDEVYVVRERETLAMLTAGEHLMPPDPGAAS